MLYHNLVTKLVVFRSSYIKFLIGKYLLSGYKIMCRILLRVNLVWGGIVIHIGRSIQLRCNVIRVFWSCL